MGAILGPYWCLETYLQIFQISANIVIFVIENNSNHDRISSRNKRQGFDSSNQTC